MRLIFALFLLVKLTLTARDWNTMEIITDGKRQTTNIPSFMLAILLGDKHGNLIKIKPLSMKG